MVYVTGTDTDAGKTFVTTRLIAALRANGIPAIGLKPVETGWNEEQSDARKIAEASQRSVAETVWRHWDLPAAPAVAARAVGERVDVDEMNRWIVASGTGAPVCFVEGAGGCLVPFTETTRFRDLVGSAEVLVVARAGLGTINHSLLTLEALAAHRVLALVLSARPDDSQVAHSNAAEIRRFTAVPILVVPEDMEALAGLFHVERPPDP